ncbi:class I SAM-dependent methyltransferase [soil metagenome]
MGLFLRPSAWLLRWPQAMPAGGRALDVACGSGRHVHHLVDRGMQVSGIDRDAAATAPLQGIAEIINADIENGDWPLAARQFDLVLVSNYLWRPLLPKLLAAVAPGGWLIYETFADGQQSIGRPARPDFLLQPAELLSACSALRIVAFEDGFAEGRYVQRIAAVRPAEPALLYPRYALDTSGIE